MDLDPARQTFIAESHDLLADMEGALLQLETAPADAEAINAVFRAAHTIKGSAGVFDFTAIVEFTHVTENVLDEIRAGSVKIDADLIAVLLSCRDHIGQLVDHIARDNETISDALGTAGDELERALQTYLAPSSVSQLPQTTAQREDISSMGNSVIAADTWHISLRFGRNVLRNGMDPLSFIRYLKTLGEIVSITTLADAMPPAAEMDPESCYLGIEIDFRGAIDKETIDGVFEFVRDDCAIGILPPGSKILDYIQLIAELPEDTTQLGDLLVGSGVLTKRELEEGLALQQQLDAQADTLPSLEHTQKLGAILVGQGVVQSELVDAALNKQQAIKSHQALESNSVRVRAEKLDELITLVGELVISGAGARLIAERYGNTDLNEAHSIIGRLVEEIRDAALRLRMVPIGISFNRFNRVVRDLGRELGKDIELIISGADTELDKAMVEKISDPLMHLVRNAIDHGMESPAQRSEAGKPVRGRLQLNAYHDSGSIVIEVADDGRGLNRKKILERAVKLGLVDANQSLSDQEILNLVMEPGFSTAEEITNVSGRGMGMDVVKRNVESLHGSVSIDSVDGEGTTIAIRMPLTLAIIDGFVVGVGNSSYVIPLDMVVECLELSERDRDTMRLQNHLNLRGEALSLLRLRGVFEVEQEHSKRENVVVVSFAGRRAGIVVDRLLGEFQTVIKPLGKIFTKLQGISGSTILGTGEVALILDVQALVSVASGARGNVMPVSRTPS